MKLLRIILFLLLTVFSRSGFAQDAKTTEATTTTAANGNVKIHGGNMPRAHDYRTWDFGVVIGAAIPNTDIAASDINASNAKNELAYGLNVTKFLSHTFALRAQVLRGSLQGDGGGGSNRPYNFTTDIHYQATVNGVFQFGNISFLKRNPDWAFYASVGVGMINFTPTVTKDGFSGENNYYVQDNKIDTSVNYHNTSELVFPFAIGVKYRIAKSFSLSAEYMLNTTNTDKLDGWYRLLSEDDNYTFFNLGLTYHFGTKEKPIEWVNPLQTIYADLYDVKDKVDQLTNDMDADGVSDMFDKEPNTPKGVKVYGDGTAIDTDGDGVPDYSDIEPFTPKGVKIDANGKEIDSDGDGIGDSEDLEPNTPKGSLINKQGVGIPVAKGGGSSVMAANGWLPSIFFNLNSAVISPKYNETLAEIALVMRNNPDVKFEIVGNCDSRASTEYNIKLGNRRGEAVKNHLAKKYNIDPSRMKVITLGKNDPITKDHPMNRRVDFRVQE